MFPIGIGLQRCRCNLSCSRTGQSRTVRPKEFDPFPERVHMPSLPYCAEWVQTRRPFNPRCYSGLNGRRQVGSGSADEEVDCTA